MMPNLSGFDFLKIARTNSKLNKTHIVVVTAKDLTTQDLELLNHNKVSIISKGGNIEEIIKKFAQEIKG